MKGSLDGFLGVDRSSCAVQRRGVLQGVRRGFCGNSVFLQTHVSTSKGFRSESLISRRDYSSTFCGCRGISRVSPVLTGIALE